VGVGGDSRWAHILVNVSKVLARLRVGILALSVRVCVIQTHDHRHHSRLSPQIIIISLLLILH
jgi:hypothetical protein